MKQVIIGLVVVVLVVVVILTSFHVYHKYDTERVNEDYFETCTFLYRTSSGLEIIKNNLNPDMYINNSKTTYFVVTYINQGFQVPEIKNVKEIKPSDTLVMTEKRGLMNGVGKDAYYYSFSLLKEENDGVMVPDRSQYGVWFWDQDEKLIDYIHYENYNKQKREASNLAPILLAVSLAALCSLFLGWIIFSPSKKIK